jgi:hypothetical protein
MERLFSRGDLITCEIAIEDGYRHFKPWSRFSIREKTYQVGKIVYRKKKLLEVNSAIIASVEMYNYSSGEMVLMDYKELQDNLKNGKYRVTGKEKKKIKI